MKKFTPGEYKRLPVCAPEELLREEPKIPLDKPFLWVETLVRREQQLTHGQKVVYWTFDQQRIVHQHTGIIHREEKVKH